MFIVLEGADNSGKTSLAHRMCEKAERERGWTTELWHYGVPKRHPLDEYECDLFEHYPFDRAETHLVVSDRHFMGQLVYGGLYRDKDLLGPAGGWHVDALLRSMGTVQLILDQPLEVLLEREDRGKESDVLISEDAGYLRREHFDYVKKRYLELAERCKRSVHLAYGDVPDQIVDTILDSVAGRAAHSAELRRVARTYVGPMQPDFVLFGETRGFAEDGGPLPPGPVFMPYPNTSGRWLCEAIVGSQELSGYEIGLANALEENVFELLHALDWPTPIALGRMASQHLDMLGIAHGSVPHPQYARRFHSADRDRYATAVVHALRTRSESTPYWREPNGVDSMERKDEGGSE